MATMSRQQAPQVPIQRWANGSWIEVDDRVAAEEPLQLSLDGLALTSCERRAMTLSLPLGYCALKR